MLILKNDVQKPAELLVIYYWTRAYLLYENESWTNNICCPTLCLHYTSSYKENTKLCARRI